MATGMAAKLPRESGKFIASCSRHVTINKKGVMNVASLIYPELRNSLYSIKNWREHKLHPKELSEATVNWIFVVDTLNFCFWVNNDKEPFVVKYRGECYTGYWALCAAINRALEDGIPLTTPSYFSHITNEEFQNIFHSETSTNIPLLAERVRNLNETGEILVKEYRNSFATFLSACDKSAAVLLNKITSVFPCFKDEASFEGQKVALYKRAQILIADLWGCFEGKGYGEFHDINSLTMFADYLVPQGLQFLQVLQYSEELQRKIKAGQLLPPGSLHEVEIRGCTIWAVELICKELRRMLNEEQNAGTLQDNTTIINAVLVDFFLWDYTKKHEEKIKDFPMHKTRSIFY